MSVARASFLLLACLASPAVFAQAAPEPGAAPPQEPAQLAPVEVVGETPQAEPYLKAAASSATKTDTPLLETPASVSVIGNDLMRDRGVQTLQEALRYSAGVLPDAYGVDNRTDSAVLRGTEFQQVLDGMREQFAYYNIARPDPYALERVEILRGPASVLYGQGPVAGVVNLVTKRPKAETERELIAEIGSFDRRQLAADLTGPLTADGRWLYRVVGIYRDSGTQVDYANDDRLLLSPSLTYRPDASLEWTLLTTYQHDETANTISFLPHSGTVLPNPNGRIPVQRFTSEPGYDRFDVTKYAATSLLKWQIDPVWSLHQNLRLADNDNPYYTMYPDVFSNPADPFLDGDSQRTVARIIYADERRSRDFTADHQAQAKFTAGGVQQHLLLGIDFARSRQQSRSGSGYLATPFDLYDPVYGTTFEVPELTNESNSWARVVGLYLQNQVKFTPRWIGLFGLRHDRSRVTPDGGDSATEKATTGRAGLMYLADGGLAPYLSYGESFIPNTDVDDAGEVYEPVRGRQVEAGVKWQPPGLDTLLTLTAFDIHERNRVAYGLLGPEGLTEVDASGVEFEANTRIGPFNIVGAYTYTDAQRREYTAQQPRHLASLWTKYVWRAIELGAGVRYLGHTTDDGNTLQIPSVTLFDAMAAYNWKAWRFAVNATNLEDEVYVTGCLVRGDCFYGNRGVVVGSLSYRF